METTSAAFFPLIPSYFTFAKGHHHHRLLFISHLENIPAQQIYSPRAFLERGRWYFKGYHISYHSTLFLPRPGLHLEHVTTHESEGGTRGNPAKNTFHLGVFWQHYRRTLANGSRRRDGEHWQLFSIVYFDFTDLEVSKAPF